MAPQVDQLLDEVAQVDDDEGFYPDDALPFHYLDDGVGHQRGECPHSGQSRNAMGGCPRGCGGATEHYSNDGHSACHDPAPVRTADKAE